MTQSIYRNVLQNQVSVVGKKVPTYYYQFYEFYYPTAENDIDVELSIRVTGSDPVDADGQVTVYASTTERYPSPSRQVHPDADPLGQGFGYWRGISHTGTVGQTETCVPRLHGPQLTAVACAAVNLTSANDIENRKACEAVGGSDMVGYTCVYSKGSGSAAAPTPLNLMYTLRPQTHHDTVASGHGGVLYISVAGTAKHTPGEILPSSTYDIKVKVYRYQLESELLDLATESREDRRYSVVTMDNFKYYEARLTAATYKITVTVQVFYGEVDLYHSDVTLPTQDVTASRFGINVAAGATQSIDIASQDLNMVQGYAYVGLIGRAQDSAYEIQITAHQVNGGLTPTVLYSCGLGIVSVNWNCLAAGGSPLSQSDFGTETSVVVQSVSSGTKRLTLSAGAPWDDLPPPSVTLYDLLPSAMPVVVSAAIGANCSAAGTYTVASVDTAAHHIVVLETLPAVTTGSDCLLTFSSLNFPARITRDASDLATNAKYYALHTSRSVNQIMSVAGRSGTGSRVADSSAEDGLQSPIPSDAWNIDWVETSISTWVDDYTDELDLDLDLTVALPSAADVYMSACDRWPSPERNAPRTAGGLTGVLDNIATQEGSWAFFSIR